MPGFTIECCLGARCGVSSAFFHGMRSKINTQALCFVSLLRSLKIRLFEVRWALMR